MSYSLPLPRPLKAALLEHARAVYALMLRDIKTRFGATYFGFIVGLILPLGHIGIVMSVYLLLGRRAAIGTDVSVYLASAILPFVIWSYTHQKVMQCFGQNRALTSFPVIGFVDVLIARALVELMNASTITCVVAIALALIGADLFVNDPPILLFALITAYVLGVSTGFIFGLLSLLLPGFMIVGFVFVPLYWATSGVFSIPDGLPTLLREIVSFFPLTHVVDWGRTAVFASYISDFPNLHYVWLVILGNFGTGLAAERFLRASITAK